MTQDNELRAKLIKLMVEYEIHSHQNKSDFTTDLEQLIADEVAKARIDECSYLMRLRDELGKFKIRDRIVIINRRSELATLTKRPN